MLLDLRVVFVSTLGALHGPSLSPEAEIEDEREEEENAQRIIHVRDNLRLVADGFVGPSPGFEVIDLAAPLADVFTRGASGIAS